MSNTSKILAFAGSTRTESYNKKLIKIAVDHAKALGADVTLIDLRDYPLPLFDQDLETKAGPPENATKLKTLFFEHQGLLISSPEYNSSITGVLKNTIDWVSRKAAGEESLAAFNKKVAALISASPGELGGMRALIHLRSILTNINVLVIPAQKSVSRAADAFDNNGALKDSKILAGVQKVVGDLNDILIKINS